MRCPPGGAASSPVKEAPHTQLWCLGSPHLRECTLVARSRGIWHVMQNEESSPGALVSARTHLGQRYLAVLSGAVLIMQSMLQMQEAGWQGSSLVGNLITKPTSWSRPPLSGTASRA